jgi:hypothetical protein
MGGGGGDLGLITVSHRPSLFKYHQFLLRLDGEHGWSFEELNQQKEVGCPAHRPQPPRADADTDTDADGNSC